AVVATGSATRAQDLFWGRVYDVAESPKSIGALQIDDDGAAELFVGHDAFQGFTTLHSLGDGTYAVGSPSAAAPYTEQLLAADLNGDGRDDLVTVQPDRLEVFLDDGAGGLLPAASVYPGSATARRAIAADFDEDGHLDVATCNELSNDVSVLLGDGAGHLGAP